MEPSPPGWYRDPKAPGGRRYWDGHAWVDVDGVVDGRPESGPPSSGLRIVSQRRAEHEAPPAPKANDEVDSESLPD
ncbi:DUF2510 domain-containing protein [Marmoricola sp. URHB0036]|uniref:DUF2510 domain-containing protein n=1 Tax=Marmoricola sp. URHB0036 TaxID=1298863 RepID=UPI0004848581|nr:DUF2510 domain-containing protein [Marmoricola sp. URHB0036]